jgi:CRP-like cAMP-binding protein
MLDALLKSLPDTAVTVTKIGQNGLLFRQGETTRGFYKVSVGAVILQRRSEAGGTLILHRALAGDFIAEASIFSDVYHCDALCISDTQCIRYDRRAVLSLMRSDPNFTMRFANHLATQVQQYRAHAEILSVRSAKERVIAALYAGYHQGTVTELAGQINLTHEACYRALAALSKEKRVRRVGRGQYVPL